MNEFWRKLLDKVGANSYVATLADTTRKVLDIEPYSYIIDLDNLAAPYPTTVTQDIIMDNDSDFIWLSTAASSRVTGAATFTNTLPMCNPSLLVQITDRSKGVTMFNNPTPLPLVAGVGGWPFVLPSPKLIRPRSTLRVVFSQDPLSPANTVAAIYMAFHGAKIYYA